jgi:hypothetical protein
MNTVDKISRDVKVVADSIKDTVTTNIIASAKAKNIDISEESLLSIVKLIDISASEGYTKSLRTFQKTIEKSLGELGSKTTKKK